MINSKKIKQTQFFKLSLKARSVSVEPRLLAFAATTQPQQLLCFAFANAARCLEATDHFIYGRAKQGNPIAEGLLQFAMTRFRIECHVQRSPSFAAFADAVVECKPADMHCNATRNPHAVQILYSLRASALKFVLVRVANRNEPGMSRCSI